MHCRADASRSHPTRAILNFFSLKNCSDLDFYEQKFQETEKFHLGKVKCLVRATERKMIVWRMETNDDICIMFTRASSSFLYVCSLERNAGKVYCLKYPGTRFLSTEN